MSRQSPPHAASSRRGIGKGHFAMICLAVGLTIASLQPALADTLRWFSAGRPTATAHQAVDLLSSAADDGLDANDYDANQLRKAIDGAASG
ncbi:MAG: hypothetical protein WA787_06290, partial [Azonexus sp.]